MELRKINDRVSVSGQILAADIEAIKAAGFVAIVNNHPDGEAPDQPSDAEIGAAAKAGGLEYFAIPMGRDGVNPQMIEDTRHVLFAEKGPVLCFCRSGTRSTTLWALAQSGRMPATQIIAEAAGAGYDLSHLAGHLE